MLSSQATSDSSSNPSSEPPAVGGGELAEAAHGFLTASGKVAGERLLPRDIYWRRFPPTSARWSGKLVVVVPDYGECGRDWALAVDMLTAEGHCVITMDHAWRGYSEGEPQEQQRGYAIARDTAAVLAMAGSLLRRELSQHPGAGLVAMGAGLGASAGILLALLAQANNDLSLDGVPMPANISAVLFAPVLAPSEGMSPWLLSTVGRLPGVGQRLLPPGSDFAAAEEAARYLAACRAARADLNHALSRYQGPKLRIEVLQGNRDPVASAQAVAVLEKKLGAHLRLLHSNHHALHQQPQELQFAMPLVAGVGAGELPDSPPLQSLSDP